jgi:ABC-type ATPase involved in cell division
LARPVLTYGSEAWTIKKADEKQLQASEMKFMRRTVGYTLFDHKQSEDILKELQIELVITHVQNYHTNWRNHVRRMERVRIPKQLTTYAPRGR